MRCPIFVAAVCAIASAGAPSNAATTLFTIEGTGSGSIAGSAFQSRAYTLSFQTDGRSAAPSATYFQLDGGPRLTLDIETAFGTAFDTFYLQNLSSRFHSDFFDFTIPDPNLDIYAPFPAVTGTNVHALNGFSAIPTSAGVLSLATSSDVRFQGLAAAAAVPEPVSWAFMLVGFGVVGAAMRRRSPARTTVRFTL